MGRPKGGTNKKYTEEDRIRIIKLYVSGEYSRKELCKLENIPPGTLKGWYERYLSGGLDALKSGNFQRGGNRYAALHTAKNLSLEERQRLEILKLRVENERLKKGYTVKGVGADKTFVTSNEQNFR